MILITCDFLFVNPDASAYCNLHICNRRPPVFLTCVASRSKKMQGVRQHCTHPFDTCNSTLHLQRVAQPLSTTVSCFSSRCTTLVVSAVVSFQPSAPWCFVVPAPNRGGVSREHFRLTARRKSAALLFQKQQEHEY